MSALQKVLEKTDPGPEYAHVLQPPGPLRAFGKKLFEIYCHLLFTLYCPLKVTGRENLPEPPFLFCSNHNSHMDTGVLMIASGLSFRKFGMMAASDYFFDNSIRRFFMCMMMDLLPIERKANRRSILKMLAACRDYTNSGRNLILYPEGTRSTDGSMQEFKRGAAMIADELELPIVPAYIHGTYSAMPKGSNLMRPARLHVVIGKPVYPKEHRNGNGISKSVLHHSLTEELKNRIEHLMEHNGKL